MNNTALHAYAPYHHVTAWQKCNFVVILSKLPVVELTSTVLCLRAAKYKQILDMI